MKPHNKYCHEIIPCSYSYSCIVKQYVQSILYLSKLFMGNCKYLAANTLVLSITLVFLCNTEYCIGK